MALATVIATYERVWEIDMEVALQARGREMGRAVLGTAGRWMS